MEFDGVLFTQSMALLRYIGKLGNLYPTDPVEALRVDEIIDGYLDFTKAIDPTLRMKDDEKMAARKVIVDEKIPKFWGGVENLVGKDASGFCVGKSVTIADLAMYAQYVSRRLLIHPVCEC